MSRVLTQSAVQKKLEGVTDKLAAANLPSEKRMALLRQQAELGDLRDALADRARRRAYEASLS
jgi:cell division protein FtsB